jgi:hypothetical protein
MTDDSETIALRVTVIGGQRLIYIRSPQTKRPSSLCPATDVRRIPLAMINNYRRNKKPLR